MCPLQNTQTYLVQEKINSNNDNRYYLMNDYHVEGTCKVCYKYYFT